MDSFASIVPVFDNLNESIPGGVPLHMVESWLYFAIVCVTADLFSATTHGDLLVLALVYFISDPQLPLCQVYLLSNFTLINYKSINLNFI